ncbi:hypothetical protein GJ496_000197 [Pomphorhynchus laevis]|nr:hypothetical protein GJ496_000197 [Pomphorhynchus laevis]
MKNTDLNEDMLAKKKSEDQFNIKLIPFNKTDVLKQFETDRKYFEAAKSNFNYNELFQQTITIEDEYDIGKTANKLLDLLCDVKYKNKSPSDERIDTTIISSSKIENYKESKYFEQAKFSYLRNESTLSSKSQLSDTRSLGETLNSLSFLFDEIEKRDFEIFYLLPKYEFNSTMYNHYKLRIIDDASLLKNKREYLTLTKYSAIRIRDDSPIEHSDYLDFKMDFSKWSKLTKINTISNITQWKAVKCWLNAVKLNKITLSREHLPTNLAWLNSTVQPSLMIIRQLFCQLATCTMFNLNEYEKNFDLMSFQHKWQNQFQENLVHLTTYIEHVKLVYASVCRGNWLKEGFVPEEYCLSQLPPEVTRDLTSNNPVSFDNAEQTLKGYLNGLVTEQSGTQHYESYLKQMRVVDRLFPAMKFCDAMLDISLNNILRNTFKQLIYFIMIRTNSASTLPKLEEYLKFENEVKVIEEKITTEVYHKEQQQQDEASHHIQAAETKESSTPSSAIQIDLDYKDGDITMYPNMDQITKVLSNIPKDIFKAFDNLVTFRKSVTFRSIYRPYINGEYHDKLESQKPSPSTWSNGDTLLHSLIFQYNLLIKETFIAVNKYIENIKLFIVFDNLFTSEMNEDNDSTDVDWWDISLATLSSHQSFISLIDDYYSEGFYRISNAKFKESILQSNARSMSIMTGKLAQIVNKIINQQLEITNFYESALNRKLDSIDDYEVLITSQRDFLLKVSDIQQDFDICSRLFEILKKYANESIMEEARKSYTLLSDGLSKCLDISDNNSANIGFIESTADELINNELQKIIDDLKVLHRQVDSDLLEKTISAFNEADRLLEIQQNMKLKDKFSEKIQDMKEKFLLERFSIGKSNYGAYSEASDIDDIN